MTDEATLRARARLLDDAAIEKARERDRASCVWEQGEVPDHVAQFLMAVRAGLHRGRPMTRLGILLGLVAVLVAIAWHLRPGEPWPRDPWPDALADPDCVAALRRGIADVEAGRTVPLSKLRQEGLL